MTDPEIIALHGGPANLARLLGLTAPGSVQRVCNWVLRGIPAEIKLAHPHLFGITIGQIRTADPKPDLEGTPNNPQPDTRGVDLQPQRQGA